MSIIYRICLLVLLSIPTGAASPTEPAATEATPGEGLILEPVRGVNSQVSRDPLAVYFKGSGKESHIAMAVTVDARQYSMLEVLMTVDQGTTATLMWQSDLTPRLSSDGDNVAWVSTRLYPGQDKRMYRIPLNSGKHPAWMGTIDRLAFIPSDYPCRAIIHSIRLLPAADTTVRHNVDGAYLESAPGIPAPIPITVTGDETLEVYVGILSAGWVSKEGGDAKFIISAQTDSERLVLAERRLQPEVIESDRQWQRIAVSLANFTGKHLVISFAIDSLATPAGDYCVWSTPKILKKNHKAPQPPVILISCDTLRRDRVGVYGQPRLTPNLDAFAQDAIVFEDAITTSSWTLPSHMAMFTGLYPSSHKVTRFTNLSSDIPTITELLRDAGYRTGAFTGHPWWFMPWRGFARGFDMYDIPQEPFRHIWTTQRRVKQWLDGNDDQPFFLFFHNYDVHQKELPHPKYGNLFYHPWDANYARLSSEYERLEVKLPFDQFKGPAEAMDAYNLGDLKLGNPQHQYIVALYDDSVTLMDAALGDFFYYLKNRGVYDSSLIIVTADHGEELNEHGEYGHHTTFDSIARIPLLVKLPNSRHKGQRVTGQVQSLDIFPTILSAVGIGEIKSEGIDLVTLLNNPGATRKFASTQRDENIAVRTRSEKLHLDLRNAAYKFYDLTSDSKEEMNLLPGAETRAQGLGGQMNYQLPEATEGWHVSLDFPSLVPPTILIESIQGLEGIWKCYRDGAWKFLRVDDRYTKICPDDELALQKLVLVPASSTEPIILTIEHTSPFIVQHTDSDPKLATEQQLIFDPAYASTAPLPPITTHGDEGLIQAWFVKPSKNEAAAQPMTDEQRESLRALGYIQ